jgi:hypothetical protein
MRFWTCWGCPSVVGTVAILGPTDASRQQVAKCLSAAGIAVVEVSVLASPRRFVAIVVIDHQDELALDLRASVQAWLATTTCGIVVMTRKPVAWAPLSRTSERRLSVLATPAFGWQIVDVVRAVCADP